MKIVKNKDIVVAKFLQSLITHLFSKGELYHYIWEEKYTSPYTPFGKLIHCRARALVSFSPTHSITIKVDDFNLIDGMRYEIKGWTELVGPIKPMKVSHKETGLEIDVHWLERGLFFVNTENEKRFSKFLKEIGLS